MARRQPPLSPYYSRYERDPSVPSGAREYFNHDSDSVSEASMDSELNQIVPQSDNMVEQIDQRDIEDPRSEDWVIDENTGRLVRDTSQPPEAKAMSWLAGGKGEDLVKPAKQGRLITLRRKWLKKAILSDDSGGHGFTDAELAQTYLTPKQAQQAYQEGIDLAIENERRGAPEDYGFSESATQVRPEHKTPLHGMEVARARGYNAQRGRMQGKSIGHKSRRTPNQGDRVVNLNSGARGQITGFTEDDPLGMATYQSSHDGRSYSVRARDLYDLKNGVRYDLSPAPEEGEDEPPHQFRPDDAPEIDREKGKGIGQKARINIRARPRTNLPPVGYQLAANGNFPWPSAPEVSPADSPHSYIEVDEDDPAVFGTDRSDEPDEKSFRTVRVRQVPGGRQVDVLTPKGERVDNHSSEGDPLSREEATRFAEDYIRRANRSGLRVNVDDDKKSLPRQGQKARVVRAPGSGPSSAKFTGTVKDSQGRTICFRNGKRTPCPKKPKEPAKQDERMVGEEEEMTQERRPSAQDSSPMMMGPVAQLAPGAPVEPGALECEWYVSGGALRCYALSSVLSFASMNRALRDGMELDPSQSIVHARLQRMFQAAMGQEVQDQPEGEMQ